MTERNNPPEDFQPSSASGAAEDAMRSVAAALPSSLQELRETAGISRMMRDGSAAAANGAVGATEAAIKNTLTDNGITSEFLKNLPKDVSNKIIEGLIANSIGSAAGVAAAGDAMKHGAHDGPNKQGAIDKIGNITDGRHSIKDMISFKTEVIPNDKKGLINLSTGDKLVRAGDVEVLVAPGGDTLVVNKDGSFDIGATKGVSVKHDAKAGSTTLTYPNGDTVTIRDGRITDVDRGFNGRAHMNSALEDKLQNMLERPPHWEPRPPQPWDQIKPLHGHGSGSGGGGGGDSGPLNPSQSEHQLPIERAKKK